MYEIGQALAVAFELISSFDRELLSIVRLSLSVSLTATGLGLVIGAPIGALLAMSRFPGQQAIVVVVNALLGLPPVVVGLLVYLLLSRSGPFGILSLLFTPGAMIVAQTILTTPIVVAFVHRVTAILWDEYGDFLRIDGASRMRAAWELFLIGRGAIVTAFLAAFGRAIAEVGAIVVVGGNIRGSTRTMTTAIALETSKGELSLALALGIILISLSLLVSFAAFSLNRWTTTESRG
jgi:tungstate transport system permease protein